MISTVIITKKFTFLMPLVDARQGVSRKVDVVVDIVLPEQTITGTATYGRDKHEVKWNIGCCDRLRVVGHKYDAKEIESFEMLIRPLFDSAWSDYVKIINREYETRKINKNKVIQLREVM